MMISNSIDREKPLKLYVQLYSILKQKIEIGEWPVDSQIPTEDELCKIYDISKATVKLAVLELARQGYLRRQQGKGTFVFKRSMPEGLTMYTSFKEVMLDTSMDCSVEVLVRTVMMPTDELEIKLNIPSDMHVIYIQRRWSIHGKIVLLQKNYIPYHLCPALLEEDLENSSILDILEKKHEIKITRIKDFIESVHPSDEDGRLLGISAGSPGTAMEQVFYSRESPIMYVRSINISERFRLFFQFERKVG
jgi:GntR family transcriptional regulator